LKLLDEHDYRLIPGLSAGFDDRTEDHEVMFGLVHGIESFRGAAATKEFILSIPSMLPQAREWAKTMTTRKLNNEGSRKEYIQVLQQMDKGTKDVMVEILNEIGSENPTRFKAAVEEVLNALR
jgi:hypothetical protein